MYCTLNVRAIALISYQVISVGYTLDRMNLVMKQARGEMGTNVPFVKLYSRNGTEAPSLAASKELVPEEVYMG